jgi:hypothetical protein
MARVETPADKLRKALAKSRRICSTKILEALSEHDERVKQIYVCYELWKEDQE